MEDTADLTIRNIQDSLQTVPKTEMGQKNKWYYGFEKDLQQSLEKRIKDLDPSPPSEFNTIGEIIDSAKTAVHTQWVDEVVRLQELGAIKTQESGAGKPNEFINDANTLRKILDKEQYWKFYDARHNGDPEVWRAGVLALSQQNIATMELAIQWLNNIPESSFDGKDMSKTEFRLYLDTVLAVQSDVDHIYVKQLEIQDSVDASSLSKLPSADGTQYVYMEPAEDGESRKSFIQKFPVEITSLANSLNGLAERVKFEINKERLSLKYAGLDGLLENISSALVLEETDDFRSLYDLWTQLQQQSSKLALGGCPIIFSPPGFVGSDGVLEFDFLIGINRTLNSKYLSIDDALTRSTEDVAVEYGIVKKIPSIIRQEIKFANGTSFQWVASGSAQEGIATIVESEIVNIIQRFYDSPYAALFQDLLPTDEVIESAEACVLSHELGHFPEIDDDIYTKLGSGIHINKLEENRGDCKGAMAYLKCINNGSLSNPDAFIQAYFASSIDFMLTGMNSDADTSSTWYAFTESVIAAVLFDSGSIEWRDEKIVIVDAKKGIEEMAKLGDILINLYWKDDSNQDDAKALVIEFENKVKKSEGFQLLWQKIQDLSRQA